MQKLNLNNIPICDQIWDDMPRSERGRTCQKCQTEIIDFRKMTDLEIAFLHSQSDEKVCGIYNDSQLSGKEKSKRLFPKSILVGIFGLLSTSNVSARNFVEKEQIVQLVNDFKIDKPIPLKKDTSKVDMPFLIQGQITGKHNCGLKGVSIFVMNTRNGTISDNNGHFSLVLSSKAFEKDSVDLIFSIPNKGRIVKSYVTEDVLNQALNVELDSECEKIYNIKTKNIVGIRTITTSFGVVRKPIHKRIFYKVKGIIFRKQQKNGKNKPK